MGYSGTRFWSIFRAKTVKTLCFERFLSVLQGKYQNFRLRRYNKGVLPCVARRRREKNHDFGASKTRFYKGKRSKNGRFLVNFSEISKKPPLFITKFKTRGGFLIKLTLIITQMLQEPVMIDLTKSLKDG